MRGISDDVAIIGESCVVGSYSNLYRAGCRIPMDVADAMVIQEWVTERASAAIEKRVTIAGPVSWTLSPSPTIILKQVSIAEHLDRDSADFATAGTVKASIALLPLLHRSIVIPSLAINDLEVVLKPEADTKPTGRRLSAPDRLTRQSRSSRLSRSAPSISAEQP